MIFSSPQSDRVKPAEVSSTITSMAGDDDETLHSTMVLKNAGPSNAIYEIIMVSISGSMLLLAMIFIAVKVFRKQSKLCCSSNDPSTTEVVLENSTMKHNRCDKISTVDITGAACINYFSEQETLPRELPSSENKLSSCVLPENENEE